MDFTIKVNGVSFEITNTTPAAAAALLREIAGDHKESESLSSNIGSPDAGDVEECLAELRGTRTSEFLISLSKLPGWGGTDDVIKKAMSNGGEKVNLAPFVSSISKICKRKKIQLESILVRKQKRGRAGKMHYHYSLTEKAAAIVLSIADFGKPIESSDLVF